MDMRLAPLDTTKMRLAPLDTTKMEVYKDVWIVTTPSALKLCVAAISTFMSDFSSHWRCCAAIYIHLCLLYSTLTIRDYPMDHGTCESDHCLVVSMQPMHYI